MRAPRLVRSSVALAIAAGVASCAPMAERTASPAESREDRLALFLGNRLPASPVACVNSHDLRQKEVFPEAGAIALRGRGNTVYLNRFRGQCDNVLRDGLAMVTSTTTGRLCEGDLARFVDTSSGVERGVCALGTFTPYETP